MNEEKKAIRTLILDDDPMVCQLVSLYLKNAGQSDCETAHSVREAKLLLKNCPEEQPFNAIFCDLDMPDEDGFDFISYCEDKNITTPIVIMSGHSQTLLRSVKNIMEGLIVNIFEVIEKPFQLNDIISVQKNLLTYLEKQKRPPLFMPDISFTDILNNLIVYYQPKVSVSHQKIIGAEVLARVDHPEFGFLSPAQFLDKVKTPAEHLHFAIGTLQKAMEFIQENSDALKDVKLAVNLTISSLRHPLLIDAILNLKKRYKVPSSRITFEVTEDEIFSQDMQLVKTVGKLVLQGFTFSMDDFGTGYSNLERIKLLPISEVKLDRSFVQEVVSDPFSQQVARSVIAMAHSLNMTCVIEGVETKEEQDFLASLGPDLFQGYLFSKPLSKEDFLAFILDPENTIASLKDKSH